MKTPEYVASAHDEAAILGVKDETVYNYRSTESDYPPATACPCCGTSVRSVKALLDFKASRPGRGAGGGRKPQK